MPKIRVLLLRVLLLLAVGGCLPVMARGDADAVVLHLVTVGDSRAEPGDAALSPHDRPWLQSTRTLARLLREMQAAKPQLLVFNGDMIYGYSEERAPLDRQYAYWRGMVATLMATGTYVLPVPGNHEVQVRRAGSDGSPQKVAVVSSELAWRDNMGDLVLDTGALAQAVGRVPAGWSADNRPVAPADGISTDQRQLSYSFDLGTVHLAVINTDPVGFDSSAPAAWLAADFAAARGRGAQTFLVFGHKMAFTYVPVRYTEGVPGFVRAGLDVRPAERDAFWEVIERYGATYFCGHEHVFHAEQPRLAAGGKAWQVIVGSGGSPFSVSTASVSAPSDRMYAWADVRVHASGKVEVSIFGFAEDFGPTRELQSWTMP